MNPHNLHDVVVIGAGIIGISIALKLQSQGFNVVVLDQKGVASQTSSGNAGAFAFTDIIPLATPGIMRKAPKWLVDPLGPLSIPPAYALKILPWMLKFWRASWPDRYQAALAAQVNLMQHAQSALERQIQMVQGESFMRREGQLQLYEGEKSFRASLAGWALRREHGIDVQLLHSPDDIAAIQPGIHQRFTHAGFTPEWINTCDPLRWTQHLANHFCALGGHIAFIKADRLTLKSDSVQLLHSAGQLVAKTVVVAAGAWSNRLAQSIGDDFPLETERGYNTTLPAGKWVLKTHLSFSDHGFVVSRINEGIRVGGAVELGGLTLAPNFRRADALLNKAIHFLPQLNGEGGQQWMGFRPSMPDSLPVIDYSPRSKQVIYAFGHGHLGLTQSAGTAELVSELVRGSTPTIAMAPFSAKRF